MGYLGNQITTVFPTSISVDSLTVGDSHTIGNQSSNDNLLIKSSSSENIEFDSINGSHIFKKNDTENFKIVKKISGSSRSYTKINTFS